MADRVDVPREPLDQEVPRIAIPARQRRTSSASLSVTSRLTGHPSPALAPRRPRPACSLVRARGRGSSFPRTTRLTSYEVRRSRALPGRERGSCRRVGAVRGVAVLARPRPRARRRRLRARRSRAGSRGRSSSRCSRAKFAPRIARRLGRGVGRPARPPSTPGIVARERGRAVADREGLRGTPGASSQTEQRATMATSPAANARSTRRPSRRPERALGRAGRGSRRAAAPDSPRPPRQDECTAGSRARLRDAALSHGIRRRRTPDAGGRGRGVEACFRGSPPARSRRAPPAAPARRGHVRRHGGVGSRARPGGRQAVRGAGGGATFVVCLFDADPRARRGDRGRPPGPAADRGASGVAARHLARRERGRSGSSAAGYQAETQVACIRAALPSIERVVAYCRTPERLARFCERVGAEPAESHRDGAHRTSSSRSRARGTRCCAGSGCSPGARRRRRREPPEPP